MGSSSENLAESKMPKAMPPGSHPAAVPPFSSKENNFAGNAAFKSKLGLKSETLMIDKDPCIYQDELGKLNPQRRYMETH